jgi:hypothetical protein
MSELRNTYEDAVEVAKAKGCCVIEPGARELFVDIDSDTDLAIFSAHVARLQQQEPLTYIVRTSPSGEAGHYHATVMLGRDITSEEERLLLQAVLGSDRMREMLGWMRFKKTGRAGSLFFEKLAEVKSA